MGRLWIRLSLAFAGVTIIGFITVMVVMYFLVKAANENTVPFEEYERFSGLIEELTTYYETQQSWNGVTTLFAGAESTLITRFDEGVAFTLTDAAGTTVYGGPPTGNVITSEDFPITAAGTEAGKLTVYRIEQPVSEETPPRWRFPRAEDIGLMTAFVGSAIGILFGILMARNLTAPLDKLAEAAEDIGARHLDRRVEVGGPTEVVGLAQSFNNMAAALERAEKLRSNMVADLAHELRTPITALQSSLYAILDDAYPLTKSEIAGLYEQTRLLSRLVKDLQELSQAEAGQLAIHPLPVQPSQMLEELAAPFNYVTKHNGITLEIAIPPDLPAVQIDAERINQVMHNLLNNALRHTPKGGTITLRAENSDSRLLVTVKDTGDGIPPDHLSHVFERFYRADPSRSRDGGGAGLGLAIAKAIVEAHGGKIEVASKGIHGEGTTFTVQLPLAPIA